MLGPKNIRILLDIEIALGSEPRRPEGDKCGSVEADVVYANDIISKPLLNSALQKTVWLTRNCFFSDLNNLRADR